jgi:hypothetical protein
MKPNQVRIGLKLTVAGLLLFLAVMFKPLADPLFLLAGVVLMAPTRWTARKLTNKLYEGEDPDDDDADKEKYKAELKKILGAVRKQTEKILTDRGVVDKKAIKLELDTRMAALKDVTIDEAKELKAWLDKGPKGLRSMLKKQGEEIKSLKEIGKKRNKSAGNIVKDLLEEKSNMEKIERIMKTRKGNITLNVRAAVVMTTDNAGAPVGNDDLPDDLIESFSVSAFVPKRQAREYVFDMATRRTVSEITQFKIWLEEGDVEGGFAVVAEGGLKPLVSAGLVRNYVEYKKIAAKQVYTEEFAKFRKEAYTIVQRMIQQKLLRDYAALLTTDLLAEAAPYVSSALDDQYANPTDYHAIGAVAAQIEALDFFPDMLIMNPQDKWRIGLTQDQQGQFYLQIPVTNPQGQTQMMGFVLRTSNRIPVGYFILGESGLWEIEDEPIKIKIGMGVSVTGGTSNGGGNVTDVQADFDHNRFRVIVETYFRNYIASNNQGSFVYASFETVKAALQSE